MRFSFILIAVGLGVAAITAASKQTVSTEAQLKELRWQKRVLLIHSPDSTSAAATDFKRQSARYKAEIRERDLVALPADTAALVPYKMPNNSFSLVLIGKDGGVKACQSNKIDLPALFQLIDSMPMRQREMRERKE